MPLPYPPKLSAQNVRVTEPAHRLQFETDLLKITLTAPTETTACFLAAAARHTKITAPRAEQKAVRVG